LVATNPDVERKGKAMPHTSRKGHIFSFRSKEGKLAIRLPDADRDTFVERYGTEPVVQYGAVMKEYVEVPQELLEDNERTEALLRHELPVRTDPQAEVNATLSGRDDQVCRDPSGQRPTSPRCPCVCHTNV
jgi:hypothetical protein